MTQGLICHIRSELRDSVIKVLKEICESQIILQYDSINADNPLRIATRSWQEADKWYLFNFWFEIKQELFQFDADNIITKKSVEASLMVLKEPANYGCVVQSSNYARGFLSELNRDIAKKINTKKSPFQLVNLNFNNENIDKLRAEKQIQKVVLLYSNKTQDDVLKNFRLEARKEKDLTEQSFYETYGKLVDRYNAIKFSTTQFRSICRVDYKGSVTNFEPQEKFFWYIGYIIPILEKNVIIDINDFQDLILS